MCNAHKTMSAHYTRERIYTAQYSSFVVESPPSASLLAFGHLVSWESAAQLLTWEDNCLVPGL